ncbi:energy transducer TonB family protein [Lysobacter xanthus]
MSVAVPGRDAVAIESRRLGITLAVSLALHLFVILAVGFAPERAAPVVPTLDVIFSETQSALTPKQADFLAQANNQGGGEHEKTSRPREPQSGTAPQVEAGVAPRELRAQSPAPTPPPQARIVSSTRGPATDPTPQVAPTPTETPAPPGPEKIERDARMARLAAEIHLRSERYAKRPKRKFVSASTQEYAWATYLRGWVDRVERVGNLNYPDEARRRRLSGMVVITIAIRRNGTVERADIVQSSGVATLDQAALRIARMAEPYPPLPKTQEDPDILHVTRTWWFRPEGSMVDD